MNYYPSIEKNIPSLVVVLLREAIIVGNIIEVNLIDDFIDIKIVAFIDVVHDIIKKIHRIIYSPNLTLEKDDILICDKEKALCVAGIIGSSNSEVDKNSKSILIESAVFSKVPVRISSRRLKISSLASFRFERGVDPLTSFEFAKIFAQRVIEICGGKVTYYSSYKSKKVSGDIIDLRVNRVNALLGTSLSKEI